MYRFLYFAILLMAICSIIFLLNELRKKSTNELEKVLYIQNKPKIYLQLLKNPKLKILYKRSILLQFELNAYLLLGDDFKTENIIKELDVMKMTKGESLEYCQKKLSYYCTGGNKAKALETLNKLECILAKIKGAQTEAIFKESKLIFDIYINQDTKLIKELELTGEKESGVIRGLTLYRLAKLSYFDQRYNKAKAYLNEAKGLLNNTAWFDIVESALKDMSILNYK